LAVKISINSFLILSVVIIGSFYKLSSGLLGSFTAFASALEQLGRKSSPAITKGVRNTLGIGQG